MIIKLNIKRICVNFTRLFIDLFIKFIYYLFITYLLDDESKITIEITNILKTLDKTLDRPK